MGVAIAGGMMGTDPAPDRKGEIAARERQEPEGGLILVEAELAVKSMS